MAASTPSCPKCWSQVPGELLNAGRFAPCPECKTLTWAEAFPNYGRVSAKGRAAELSVGGEEARCFYHDTRKAAEVCGICGRFLCGLCDCLLNGSHYCPGCIEAGRSSRQIQELDNSRTLYGRQAFLLAIVPLYVTGILAVFMALRYRNSPASLVRPQQWMFSAALALGALQTAGFTLLIVMAALG